MNTYLLVWNPKRWKWGAIDDEVKQVDKNGVCSLRWSCGNTKGIQPGDRLFLIKVGTEPKGIIGSGFAKTPVYSDRNWNGKKGRTNYIEVDFEILLNPDKDPILTLDILKKGKLSNQTWTPQMSGISIKPDIVDKLESIWFEFISTKKIRYNPFLLTKNNLEKTYSEGTPNQILMTKYERNPYARKVCIDHYGLSCTVCGFNFEKIYGIIGKDFIHVHHLTPLARLGKKLSIDPIKDLRPICANCHSMIHRTKETMSLEDLKQVLKTEH